MRPLDNNKTRPCLRKSGGFSLIELMLVVATTGGLIAIALPVYQNYTKRAKISEGLALSSNFKTTVIENLGNGKQYDTGAPRFNATQAVSNIAIDNNNGVITILYKNVIQASGTLKLVPYTSSGNTHTLLPNSITAYSPPTHSIEWVCLSDSSTPVLNITSGTLKSELTPRDCR